jgi:lipopolysaccharide/colanic/teichoic acid biosynthesis glycosyltransferase
MPSGGGLPMSERYSVLALARHAVTGAPWQRAWRAAEPSPSYDVVIIGGALSGAATAALLLRLEAFPVHVLSLPLLLITALALTLQGGGPLLYRQERVGLHGVPFTIVKFRSMRVDAEKDGPRWAASNDSRVTPIGSFIRRTRIDELPQIFNVLKGDMSIVGPRPERPIFVQTLAEKISYYQERHLAKPGITGWAQINYPYGATEEDAKMKLAYDLYYIKNRNIFLDVVIIIQTLEVLLWNSGAR